MFRSLLLEFLWGLSVLMVRDDPGSWLVHYSLSFVFVFVFFLFLRLSMHSLGLDRDTLIICCRISPFLCIELR